MLLFQTLPRVVREILQKLQFLYSCSQTHPSHTVLNYICVYRRPTQNCTHSVPTLRYTWYSNKAYDLQLICATVRLVTDIKMQHLCFPATKHVLRLIYFRKSFNYKLADEKLWIYDTATLPSVNNTVRLNVQLTQTMRHFTDHIRYDVLWQALDQKLNMTTLRSTGSVPHEFNIHR
jgi:hypothetical protein